MSIFKKLFGSSDPLSNMRRALDQKRWADALAIGEGLDPEKLSPEARAESEGMASAAGDGLAELNLQEGEAFLRAGEKAAAAEHFSLAARYARSSDLIERIARAQEDVGQSPGEVSTPEVPEPALCAPAPCLSGCGGGGGAVAEVAPLPPSDLDVATRYGLILTSYPPVLEERYQAMGEAFQEAFLFAHEGEETEAFARFEGIPEGERNDLYFFERGSLSLRLGKGEAGVGDLERAIDLNPENLLAFETLVNFDLEEGRDAEAEARLRKGLEQGLAPGFIHGRLAAVYARRDELETALQHGLEALNAGVAEPETLTLIASLLEMSGRPEEAEQLLTGLPGGGCSGGPDPALAEFWLRQGKNAAQALETFKDALRREPDNPRWPLRIAQAYVARGWRREAFPLAEKVLESPGLDPALQREALAVLALKESS